MTTVSKLPASARTSRRIRALFKRILEVIAGEPGRQSVLRPMSEPAVSDGFGGLGDFGFRAQRLDTSINHRAHAAPECILDCRKAGRSNAA